MSDWTPELTRASKFLSLVLRHRPEAAGVALDAEAVAFLLRTHREALAALAADVPGAAILARVEQVCGEVRRGFLQHELKSYDVMQRTLSAAPA
jgi:hypothetical protein